jgi:hypothetical protein
VVDALTTVAAVLCGVVAVYAAGMFASGRNRPRGLDLMVWVLEGVLALRAMVGIARMATDDESTSVTHVGYLAISVAIVPLVVNMLQGDRSRWSSAGLGVAALVVLVVVLRLQVTTGG